MKINLEKCFFSQNKITFLEYGEFKIKAFRYSTGIEALEITNSQCSFIFTPFKGQQSGTSL